MDLAYILFLFLAKVLLERIEQLEKEIREIKGLDVEKGLEILEMIKEEDKI